MKLFLKEMLSTNHRTLTNLKTASMQNRFWSASILSILFLLLVTNETHASESILPIKSSMGNFHSLKYSKSLFPKLERGVGGEGNLPHLTENRYLNRSSLKSPSLLAQKGLQENLKDFQYWLNLCSIGTESGKYEEALSACEQAIIVKPKDPLAWSEHSGILLKLKQYPQAIASANRALNFNSKTSLALTYKCIAFQALGRTEEALDTCNQALKVDANWGQKSPKLAWLYRGIILTEQKKYKQATIAYDRTLLLEPKDSLTLAYRCDVLTKRGKFKAAISSCSDALAGNGKWGDKNQTFALANRALAYRKLDKLEAAISDYDRLLTIDPTNSIAWGEQGIVLEKLSQYTEALTSYNRAIEINPKYSLALVGKCTILNRNKQYEEAQKSCDAAIAGDNNWQEIGIAQAWNERSAALTGNAKYKAALASANRAIGMKADYPEAWNNHSVALWHLDKYQEALESTKKAIKYKSKYAQAWLNQGVVLSTQKKYKKALKAYNKSVSIEPKNYEAWSNRSVILWHLGQYDRALTSINKAIALNENAFEVWYNRGLILTSLKNSTQALEAYNRAIKINPENADAITGRGIALSKLKRYPKAIAALQIALKINPKQRLAKQTLKEVMEQMKKNEEQKRLEEAKKQEEKMKKNEAQKKQKK